MLRSLVLLVLAAPLLALACGCGKSSDNNPRLKEGTSAPTLRPMKPSGPGGAQGPNAD
jgi:hypothetical protein